MEESKNSPKSARPKILQFTFDPEYKEMERVLGVQTVKVLSQSEFHSVEFGNVLKIESIETYEWTALP